MHTCAPVPQHPCRASDLSRMLPSSESDVLFCAFSLGKYTPDRRDFFEKAMEHFPDSYYT